MRKDERLVNLIALLLNTRRPLTVDEVRNTVPGYQQEDYASFKRMFERDKEELRSLGIPIERRYTDAWEVEEGYLIQKDRYYLPELDFTDEEYAALWIASRIVVEEQSPREDRALLKLEMGSGISGGPASPPWLRARLHLDAPSLPILLEAVATRRRVTFGYKPAGRPESQRTIEPYALIHRQGAWYVAGHDQLRGAVRHFKLQRMTGPVAFASKGPGPEFDVPEDFNAGSSLAGEPWVGEEGTTVEVAFSPRIAWWVEQSLGLDAAGTWKDWTLVRLPVVDEDGFLSWLVGFGEDAMIRSPERMRKAMVDRLRAFTAPARRRTATAKRAAKSAAKGPAPARKGKR